MGQQRVNPLAVSIGAAQTTLRQLLMAIQLPDPKTEIGSDQLAERRTRRHAS